MSATEAARPKRYRGIGRRGLLVFVALAIGVAAGRVITYDSSGDAGAGTTQDGDAPEAADRAN